MNHTYYHIVDMLDYMYNRRLARQIRSLNSKKKQTNKQEKNLRVLNISDNIVCIYKKTCDFDYGNQFDVRRQVFKCHVDRLKKKIKFLYIVCTNEHKQRNFY